MHRVGGIRPGFQQPMGIGLAPVESQFSHIFCPLGPCSASSPFLCPVGRKGVWESLSKPPTCMCMSVCRVCVHVECARVCMCMCMHTCVIGAEMELLL